MNFREVRRYQQIFEDNLVGTDGSLKDHNTPEHALRRGIIGEAMEALEALEKHGVDSEQFRSEICDILVFFGTLLNHIGMSEAEMESRVRLIIIKNFIKYRPEYGENRTIAQLMSHSREMFNAD